jgi:hypothetical protein
MDIFENIDYVWDTLDEGLNDAISAHRTIEQNAGKN